MKHVCPTVCTSSRATRIGRSIFLIALLFARPVFAQSVPSPWAGRDIGTPAVAGSSSYNSGKFTIQAAGSDIWGNTDQFHFVYQQITGDTTIIARVDSVTKANPW